MSIMLLQILLLFSPLATPEQEIRAILAKQVADWNRGDIRAFMEGYEESESLTFVGKNITRGHAKVLANYLQNYPSREKMGHLQFEVEEVRMLGSSYASVIGKWKLVRTSATGGDAQGIYTLIFRRGSAGWLIIQDHTS